MSTHDVKHQNLRHCRCQANHENLELNTAVNHQTLALACALPRAFGAAFPFGIAFGAGRALDKAFSAMVNASDHGTPWLQAVAAASQTMAFRARSKYAAAFFRSSPPRANLNKESKSAVHIHNRETFRTGEWENTALQKSENWYPYWIWCYSFIRLFNSQIEVIPANQSLRGFGFGSKHRTRSMCSYTTVSSTRSPK